MKIRSLSPKLIAYAILVIGASSLAGCYPSPGQSGPLSSYLVNALQSWLGHSEAELVKVCGQPNSTHLNPDGTRLLTYEMHGGGWSAASTRLVKLERGDDPRTAVVGTLCGGTYVTREFTVSHEHVIIAWAANGE